MDRRKYKRVALAIGLLFLILAAEALLYYKAGVNLRLKEQERLGALILEHPELEKNYIAAFREKNPDGSPKSDKEQEEAARAGQMLEERYGYQLDKGLSREIMNSYAVWMGMVLVLGMAGIILLLVKNGKEQEALVTELEYVMQEIEECQSRFDQMKTRLEKEEGDTKALITDISHQLKTPIASLKMSYEIAETTDLSESERMEFKEKEHEEVTKLETLLESLLNLSKLEAKLIQVSPREASLKETLVKAVNSIYMKAHDKHMGIALEEFKDCRIPHDPKWTSEVFVNILDNGIKYSQSGTEIVIRVSEMVSYMLIEIEDEGPGIPAAERHLVFKRFYRGAGEEVASQEGSGVGLYLARRILEEQGGSICVRQGAKQGSIFQVTLPKVR